MTLTSFAGKISVIATNSEKYVSFKLNNLVFKDSMQLLTGGLDKLVKNLPADELFQTSELAEELNVPLSMLQRKGVYPYSWVNSVDRFAATELPPVEAFHSDLDDKKCKRDDYKHALEVWEAAKCQTFGDYHDLYLRLDVTLLADVFESFRRSAHRTYGLDPAHFYTLPGFSWQALFKHTDPDICISPARTLSAVGSALSH